MPCVHAFVDADTRGATGGGGLAIYKIGSKKIGDGHFS